ncbi:MAG: bifunctional precorrin-2 dehydrogenase/sirohydrochlorin ferrochelatase [Leadbetterella sp.]|nr:bifunctional precorrin-2 dehydrogenase/sirohydrochlorin ferrochelatase [Leadbetterella sp.]
MNELFPIFLKMHEIRTLLVGAGPVGLEKLQAILKSSPRARVEVVAQEADEETQAFIAQHDTITLHRKAFEESDLDGKDLVILATNNAALNERIRTFAEERHILLNVADKPDLCNFYLGSVVQKGNLKLGISTNGKSPTMAKRLKEFFNDILPEEIDETLQLMQEYRNQLKGDFRHKVETLNAHTREFIHDRAD